MSLKSKLFACLALMALAQAVLGTTAYVALNGMTGTMRTILEDRVVPMEQLKHISDLYAIDIVDTTQKTHIGSMKAADAATRVAAARKEIDRLWAAYTATQMTEEENRIIQEFTAARSRSEAGLDKLQAILASGNLEQVQGFIDTELYGLIDPLADPVNRLIRLQSRVTAALYADSRVAWGRVQMVFFTLSGLVAVVFAASLWTVSRGWCCPCSGFAPACSRLPAASLPSPSSATGGGTRWATWPGPWPSSATSARSARRWRRRWSASAP